MHWIYQLGLYCSLLSSYCLQWVILPFVNPSPKLLSYIPSPIKEKPEWIAHNSTFTDLVTPRLLAALTIYRACSFIQTHPAPAISGFSYATLFVLIYIIWIYECSQPTRVSFLCGNPLFSASNLYCMNIQIFWSEWGYGFLLARLWRTYFIVLASFFCYTVCSIVVTHSASLLVRHFLIFLLFCFVSWKFLFSYC